MSEINPKDNNNDNLLLAPSQNINDKILPNNQNLKMDMMQFKDEILGEIKYLKKSFTEKYDFTTSLINDKFKKYEEKLTNYSERITEINSHINHADDQTKEIKTLLEFKNKMRDSMLTMDIKINNVDRESKNAIFRIDNILTDSVVYPGIIGKGSKFKTFRQMLDYLLAQASQNLTYREKNNLDLTQLKKKINTIEQNMQNMKDNMSNQMNIMLNKKMDENEKNLKNLFSTYNERLTGTRAENAEYIQNIQQTVYRFKQELDEFEKLKNKITDDIKEEGRLLREENEKTQNIFRGYKKEFNLMKDRFTQLSEFVKDVRFRINLGQEVKRREYYHISSKLNFSKKQKIENDNYINIYNNKYQDENELPDFIRNNYYSIEENIPYRDERFHSAEPRKSKKFGFLKKHKNKGRNNNSLGKTKEGKSYELSSRENPTTKTNKTYDELYENNIDKYSNINKFNFINDININEEEKLSLFNNKSSKKKKNKINKQIKKSFTMNPSYLFGSFNKYENNKHSIFEKKNNNNYKK